MSRVNSRPCLLLLSNSRKGVSCSFPVGLDQMMLTRRTFYNRGECSALQQSQMCGACAEWVFPVVILHLRDLCRSIAQFPVLQVVHTVQCVTWHACDTLFVLSSAAYLYHSAGRWTHCTSFQATLLTSALYLCLVLLQHNSTPKNASFSLSHTRYVWTVLRHTSLLHWVCCGFAQGEMWSLYDSTLWWCMTLHMIPYHLPWCNSCVEKVDKVFTANAYISSMKVYCTYSASVPACTCTHTHSLSHTHAHTLIYRSRG